VKRVWVWLTAIVLSLVGLTFGIASTPAFAVETDVAAFPTSHDFGNVNVGATSSPMVTVITNTGSDPFGPMNIFGGAPPTPEFNASQNCQGTTLAPGGSCEISYTFTPSGPGPFSDVSNFTVSETANQADGENFTVNLTGVGVNPITAAPLSHDFGNVNVGATSPPMVTTITNTGGTPFGPVNIFGGAPPTPEFSASQNCQGTTLAPGGSCEISYTFTPSGPGPFSDVSNFTVSATSSQAAGEDFTVNLAGCGVAPGGACPPSATTTTLESSVNPSTFGQAVTFTATVDAPSISDVPTGSVTFVDTTTSTTLGTVALDSSGQASFTTSTFAVGSHAIQATYTPDSSDFAGSVGSLTQVVNPAATTIDLSSAPNPSVAGQAVTVTANVTAEAPSTASPTGSVSIEDLTTGATLGTAAIHSPATFTTDSLGVGTHVLRVTFTPDSANFTGSSAEITQTVLATGGGAGLPVTGSSLPRLLVWSGTLLVTLGTVLLIALRRPTRRVRLTP